MDHYKTLGVNKNATPEEIKKAYRKLASTHHPDKGGDTAVFQNVQNAYDTLSDAKKRHQYDNPQPQGMHGFPGGFQFHAGGGGIDMNDLFGSIFGQRQQHHGPRQQLFRTQVQVSLNDAYNGASQTLKIQTPTENKVINIDIPKGAIDGSQIKYDNIIDNGILVVELRVMPDLKFERRGNDLYCNHSISVLDLIVGTTFKFLTISGKTLEISVPPKTQPFAQLKMGGHGMPIQNTGLFGDQIVLLKPFVPDIISDDITQSILRSKSL